MQIPSDPPQAYDLWIDGGWRPAAGGLRFTSVDPTTGQPRASYAVAETSDVDAAVTAAARAGRGEWATLTPTNRGRLMLALADMIASQGEHLAAIESSENGKLVREMRNQAAMAPDWLRYFGGLSDKIEGSVIPLNRSGALNYTLREPLGVIGVIIPWNSPLLLAVQAFAPALAAGNTLVIKPSEVTPGSLLELCKLAAEVGFPPGVINAVTGLGDTGIALTSHPGVAKVVFTGGLETGRAVATATAERGAECVLELGGKSPNIVFADADLDAACVGVAGGIFGAGGQSCTAGSRALIEDSIYDLLLERVVERAREMRLGDPADPTVQMGPIATEAHLARIDAMVAGALERGARVLCGGRRAQVEELLAGFFYEPTVLVEVSPNDPIAQEEVFGPVLTVFPFATEEEAVQLANDTPFGLAAGVWTRDVKRAHRLAARLQAGTVWINMYRAMTFNSPFGGYGDSGSGRLNGVDAVNEFLQVKSVWLELSDEVRDPLVLTR